jgi:hypothetical protein
MGGQEHPLATPTGGTGPAADVKGIRQFCGGDREKFLAFLRRSHLTLLERRRLVKIHRGEHETTDQNSLTLAAFSRSLSLALRWRERSSLASTVLILSASRASSSRRRARPLFIARRASWLSRKRASVGEPLPPESSMAWPGCRWREPVVPATSCSKRPDAKPDLGRGDCGPF